MKRGDSNFLSTPHFYSSMLKNSPKINLTVNIPRAVEQADRVS